jgi:hypothetical protein
MPFDDRRALSLRAEDFEQYRRKHGESAAELEAAKRSAA